MVGLGADRVVCCASDVLVAGNSGVSCGFEATTASIAGAALDADGGAGVALDEAGLTEADAGATADADVTATVDDVR